MHHKDIYMTIRCLYAVASGIVGGGGGRGYLCLVACVTS